MLVLGEKSDLGLSWENTDRKSWTGNKSSCVGGTHSTSSTRIILLLRKFEYRAPVRQLRQQSPFLMQQPQRESLFDLDNFQASRWINCYATKDVTLLVKTIKYRPVIGNYIPLRKKSNFRVNSKALLDFHFGSRMYYYKKIVTNNFNKLFFTIKLASVSLSFLFFVVCRSVLGTEEAQQPPWICSLCKIFLPLASLQLQSPHLCSCQWNWLCCLNQP